ncbi:MAG: hypothetical protein ACP5N3_03770 [Candidatus Nanoarchaeia archaeon]
MSTQNEVNILVVESQVTRWYSDYISESFDSKKNSNYTLHSINNLSTSIDIECPEKERKELTDILGQIDAEGKKVDVVIVDYHAGNIIPVLKDIGYEGKIIGITNYPFGTDIPYADLTIHPEDIRKENGLIRLYVNKVLKQGAKSDKND